MFPEHLLPFHQIRVTKALYDIMGVDVKHFIIEAYEQPVYLLVIVTFYNTHHDLLDLLPRSDSGIFQRLLSEGKEISLV